MAVSYTHLDVYKRQLKPCTNAPHVHREHLHHILLNHRAAVAYLLKHGEIYIHSAARPPTGILQVFGISEQDSGCLLYTSRYECVTEHVSAHDFFRRNALGTRKHDIILVEIGRAHV